MGEFKTWLIKSPNIFSKQELSCGILQSKRNNYNGVKMKFKRYNYATDVLHFYIYYIFQNAFQNKWTVKVNAFVNAIMINEIIINQ